VPVLASLTARDLTRLRGGTPVLDGVSLAVSARARIGVVGPNGVGKTTLLRIMAGLDEPDGGRVDRAPRTLTVGYLPQEPDRLPTESLLGFLSRHTGVADAELRMADAAAEMASVDRPPGAAESSYSEALEAYLGLGGPDLEARGAAVVAQLGLDPAQLGAPASDLSGGEAARAGLAAVVLSRFDVLLLDEPTNNLDFAALDQLEGFMASSDAAVVVVSHDRAFLERTVDTVVELDAHTRRATEFRGGWAGYLRARAIAREHAEVAYRANRAERDRLVERARRQRDWAAAGARRDGRRAPDHDKAQRDWRINRTEKQASKIRATERALGRLGEVDKPWEPWRLDLRIPATARSGDVVVRLVGGLVERGGFRLGPMDVELRWAERVAIVGPNGSGKSTLVSTLLGRLDLRAGSLWRGPSVVVGEMEQSRACYASAESLLSVFASRTGQSVQEARSALAKLGLTAEHAERPCRTLSPGEATRAVLGELASNGVNLLVLDEPTNHLDLEAIEQLESALRTFDGTLLIVSHDRQLLREVEITRRIELGPERPGLDP
jgi:ATPase subunit of ABC transporter with duplicated ATPase domains